MQPERSRRLASAALCLIAASTAPAQEQPSVEALEERGVVISRINIQIDDVFDTTNPAEDKRLYRWANRVHRQTRPSIVEDILLFEVGDDLIASQLAETARLLRERGFVADASVSVSNFDPATNTADVDIWIRDAWSLEPDLKLSRGGGENEFAIGLDEDNLFGLGKSLTISYSTDVDRDVRLFSYTDENLFGSRKRVNVAVADMSDGRQFRLNAGRPFFALDTRWSVTGDAIDDQRIDPIYDLGEIIDEFRHDTRVISVQGGLSNGLVDGVTRRWLAGMTLEEDEFLPSPKFVTPILLPENRKLIYPWAGFQIIGDDYREVFDLNDMGRTEDLAMGLNLFARVGVASTRFDSDRRAVLLDFSASRGWEPRGDGSLFLFASSASTRVEKGDPKNTIVSLSGSFLQRNFGDELFLATFRTTLANKLDAENQILLGGDNDLRGYPLRYQSGERAAILSIEQRFYTDWYPFRLIRVGYAFFFDAGRVWGDDSRNTPNLGTLYNVGVGLRLTSPRSSSRAVVHIDLAIPIDAPADIDDLQIVLEKKASF